MPVPGRELVDPWISKLTYTYLDSVIIAANRVAHLSFDQLPALLDVDHAAHLIKDAFRVRLLTVVTESTFMFISFSSTSIPSKAPNAVISFGGCFTTSVSP